MRVLSGLILGLATALGATAVHAQSYPARAVRVVIPYQPGTGTDIVGRYLADMFSKDLGQSFFVENRVGANGNIGSAEVARAQPDGYTLLMGTAGSHAMNPFLYKEIGFDPETDYTTIGLIGQVPLLVAANAGTPYTSMQALVDAAKAKPGAINVAHPSVTSLIIVEYLKARGVPFFGVPYKGSASAMTDTVGGQVPVVIDSITAIQPFLKSGKLRPLAVTSLKESELLPGIKSIAEQGQPGFEFVGWSAFFAPSRIPPAALATLNGEFNKLVSDPAVKKRILEFGIQPVAPQSPKQWDEFIRGERQKWGPVIKSAKITAE